MKNKIKKIIGSSALLFAIVFGYNSSAQVNHNHTILPLYPQDGLMFNGRWYPLIPGTSNLVEGPTKSIASPPFPGNTNGATTELQGSAFSIEAVTTGIVMHTNTNPPPTYTISFDEPGPGIYTLLLGNVSGRYYTNYSLLTNTFNLVESNSDNIRQPISITIRYQLASNGLAVDTVPLWINLSSNQIYFIGSQAYLGLVIPANHEITVQSNGSDISTTNGPAIYSWANSVINTNTINITWLNNSNAVFDPTATFIATNIPIYMTGSSGFFRISRM